MKNCSNHRRLLGLGGTLLIVISGSSQSEAAPSSPRLRRQKRRNAIAVGGVDESIHQAKAVQYQNIADALEEEANEATFAKDSPAVDGRNTHGRTSYNYYYTNPYGNDWNNYGGTYGGSYGDPYGGSYGNPYGNPFPSDRYYQNVPVSGYGTETSDPSSGYGSTVPPSYGTSSDYGASVTEGPTMNPTILTEGPTMNPTILTEAPTMSPTIVTDGPTFGPTIVTEDPTPTPTTEEPTNNPTGDENSVVFTYQSVAGICSGPPNGIGCANEDPEDPPAGNPNDIVNCYDAEQFGVSVPFSLNAVRVWIGDSAVLTPDLQVNVWVGDEGSGGPVEERLLYSEEQFGYTFGENTFELGMGRMIFQRNFCVGVTARSSNAGLRIMFDEGGFGESSYLRSPECGINNFISLFEAGLENDFCIEALVSFPSTF